MYMVVGEFYLADVGYAVGPGILPVYHHIMVFAITFKNSMAPTIQNVLKNSSIIDISHLGQQLNEHLAHSRTVSRF
jgi:hypothetical protein